MDLLTAFSICLGEEPTIPDEEQKYYQEPSYYKDYAPSLALDAVNGVKRVILLRSKPQQKSHLVGVYTVQRLRCSNTAPMVLTRTRDTDTRVCGGINME